MKSNDPKRWSILNDLFDAVIDLPLDDQKAKLRELALSHPDYIKDLQDIVTAHHQAERFMAEPVAVLNSMDPTSASKPRGKRSKPRVFQPGDKVGDFDILGTIGEGSFAVVYRAMQKSLERVVALKISGASDREARDMASLEHDHIVRVFSETTISEDHLHIICMQYVEGMTLAELIKRLGPKHPSERHGSDLIKIIDSTLSGNTPYNAVAAKDRDLLNSTTFINAALWIGARLAEALDFAHAKGVLHLDMKPANILLNQYGRPLLTDFNVAMNIGGVHENKKQILKGGTAGYMSPEQEQMFASGGRDHTIKITGASDIYALGIVIAELLLCKRVQICSGQDDETDGAHFLSELPDEVAGVLAKALSKDQSERFESGKDFADALENCRQLLEIQSIIKTETPWYRICENNPTTCLVLATMIPQLLGSAVNISYNSTRIAADLTAEQQQVFMDTILPYNLIVYPLCFTIVAKQIFFLIRTLKGRRKGETPQAAGMKRIRQKALASPKYLFAACTIGWLPGALIFPMIIDFQAGPISTAVYWHFGISFITSWLIALTYSYFFLELLMVSTLYPKLWSGCCRIYESAVSELSEVKSRMKLFQIMAGAIPLLGALMIVGSSSAVMDTARYRIFQLMVIILIAMAICGFVFAIKASERITTVVSTYTRKPGK